MDRGEPASRGKTPGGRIIRVMVIAFVGVGVIVFGKFWYVQHQRESWANRKAPPRSEGTAVEIPEARFTDVTASSGIRFVHNNGAYGEKLLPETMGGGVAFFDFDNDGAEDLLFINSTWWPGHIPQGKLPTTLALYRNDRAGHFTDVTTGSGLDVSLSRMERA